MGNTFDYMTATRILREIRRRLVAEVKIGEGKCGGGDGREMEK